MKTELAAAFPEPPGPAAVADWLAGTVRERVNELIRGHGGRPLEVLDIAWDLRGRMAGQARLVRQRYGLVRLNRQLFEYPGQRFLELRDTGLHEVAHLCVFSCWPDARPHGRRWRAIALALGARPRATHALPLSRARAVAEYAYRIGDSVVWLGAVRHRRLQAGTARYRWRAADGALVLEPGAFTGEVRWSRPGPGQG